MSFLLRDARVINLDPPQVQRTDLRIEAGHVADRSAGLPMRDGDEVIELGGRLVMAGMVCAHTHLYSTLARGMPAPGRAPSNFREILERVWWRLDRALDQETIYWCALAGAADAARAGTTCLFDHHASPGCIRGSLDVIREAIEAVGLRGVLCYEVTDRGGRSERDAGIEENRNFLQWTARVSPPMFRGMVGAHASFTLADGSLRACAELMRAFGSGLHIHAAEDRCDVDDARENHGLGVVERLARLGALNQETILVHCTHLDERDIAMAGEAGAWLAHNTRSNMNNQVGYAPVARLGERLVLGTDGIGADMFEETRFAFFKARDARAGLGAGDWLRVLARNQKMASSKFGTDLATLCPGSAADLIVLDYPVPTALESRNLAGHLVFAMGSALVESVMAGGKFVIRNRQPLFDARGIYEHARGASEKLWDRLRES